MKRSAPKKNRIMIKKSKPSESATSTENFSVDQVQVNPENEEDIHPNVLLERLLNWNERLKIVVINHDQ